jgi:hypothetical protein
MQYVLPLALCALSSVPLKAAGMFDITLSVTPIPEPCSLFLLMPTVVLVCLRWRHQLHRV